MDQIYGHGEGSGPDRRILSLTEQVIADALGRRASDL